MPDLKKLVVIVVFLIGVAIASFIGFKLYVDYRVKQSVDDVVRSLWSMAKVEYGDIDVELSGRVTVSNIKVRPFDVDDEITIDAVVVYVPDIEFLLDSEASLKEGKIPEQASLTISGVEIDTNGNLLGFARQGLVAMMGEEALCLSDDAKYALLAQLGYERLVMSSEIGYTYNEMDSLLTLHVKGEDQDIGVYDFNAQIKLPLSGQLASGNLAAIKLVGAELNYRDNGYHKKMLGYCAAKLGFSTDSFLNERVRQPGVAGIPGLVLGKELARAYRKFLLPGGEMEVSIKPVPPLDPVSLIFYTPEDMLRVLNLGVFVGGEPVQDLDFRFVSAREDLDEKKSNGQAPSFFGQVPSLRSLADKVLGEEVLEKENKPRVQSQKKQTYRYITVEPASLNRHVGKWVRIKTLTDFVRVGRLDSVVKGEAIVSWSVGRGEMAANIPLNRMKKVELIIAE